MKSNKTKLTVVSNFPFQNRVSAGKTQHKIWIKMTKHFHDMLENNDEMLLVSPQSWGSPSNKVLRIFQDNEVRYINFDSGEYFPDVGSSFSDYHIIKQGKSTGTTKLTINEENYDYQIDNSLLYIPNDICDLSLSIHQKVIFSQKNKLPVKHDYSTCHNILLKKSDTLSKTQTAKHIHPVFHTNRQTWFSSRRQDFSDKIKIMWTRSGYTKPFYDDGMLGGTDMMYYVLVGNESDGKNLARTLNSDLFQYIFKTAKWSGFGNEKVFKALPNILGINFHTDREMYEYFNLSDEEIEYLKNDGVAKKKKSTRKKEIRTKNRVDEFGEVFTPKELVVQMLDKLNKKDWADPDCHHIDPACGNGNFLVEIVKRKLEAGLTLNQVIASSRGVDIMPDNVIECRARVIDVIKTFIQSSGDDFDPDQVESLVNSSVFVGDAFDLDLADIKPL
jgi:hypothetical protein